MIKSILGGKSKNLFDISKADVVINANIFNPIPAKWECFYKTPVTPGQTYTVSCDTTAKIGAGTQLQLSAQTGDKWNEGTRLFMFLTSEEMTKDWVHIKATFTIPDNVTQITFSALDNKFFRNFQIEKGSTATEYVPHELTSYKSIMKVSDVCQLANSKLFTPMNGDTVIIGGVSITKNIESGTITFNGTSTHNFWYHVHDYASELRYTNVIKGYKYYISGMPVNDLRVVFQLEYLFNLQGEQIFTAPNTSNGTGAFDIYVPKGVTLTDFVVTPQLFDLTEMFGPGNEPKTVAEFKAKFPNDYYPYSPSCFVTSFDERMPCKTKNLLNITPSICKYCTYKDGILKANVVDFYYAFLKVTDLFEIGNTYTVSWSIIHKKSLRQTAAVVVYGKSKTDSDKTTLREYRSGITDNKYTFTINDEDFSSISFVELRFFRYSTITTDTESSISNVQVELGTTATDYVPYGYV